MTAAKTDVLVGVVGPCKSGKTFLKEALEEHGYQVKHIAQEHSYVATMWKQLTNPDVLIFLEVDYQDTVSRGMNWTNDEFEAQKLRLENARDSADLTINTSQHPEEAVIHLALAFLEYFAPT